MSKQLMMGWDGNGDLPLFSRTPYRPTIKRRHVNRPNPDQTTFLNCRICGSGGIIVDRKGKTHFCRCDAGTYRRLAKREKVKEKDARWLNDS